MDNASASLPCDLNDNQSMEPNNDVPRPDAEEEGGEDENDPESEDDTPFQITSVISGTGTVW